MTHRRTYHIWTIGCQMNVADSRRLASALERIGYEHVARAEEAGVIVLNTCVVRQSAEDKVYGRLGSLRPIKSRWPGTVIGLMGCLVGTGADAVESARELLGRRSPWVDVLMPPSDPGPLLDHLADRGLIDQGRALEAAEVARRRDLSDDGWLLPADEQGRLVAAYVPAVLGCSHACTYCVIPYKRGRERSRPADR